MARIETYGEFRQVLEQALRGTEALLERNPDDPMIGSIWRQLGFVEQWTRDGGRPSDEQIDKLSFGVMASRAVDDVDEELAARLYRLANYLDGLKE